MEKEMKMEPKGPKELSREQLTGMLHQLSEQGCYTRDVYDQYL